MAAIPTSRDGSARFVERNSFRSCTTVIPLLHNGHSAPAKRSFRSCKTVIPLLQNGHSAPAKRSFRSCTTVILLPAERIEIRSTTGRARARDHSWLDSRVIGIGMGRATLTLSGSRKAFLARRFHCLCRRAVLPTHRFKEPWAELAWHPRRLDLSPGWSKSPAMTWRQPPTRPCRDAVHPGSPGYG
jgi:hypothetical protein